MRPSHEQFDLGAGCRMPTVQVLKSIVILWASSIANMQHLAGPHSSGRNSNINNRKYVRYYRYRPTCAVFACMKYILSQLIFFSEG